MAQSRGDPGVVDQAVALDGRLHHALPVILAGHIVAEEQALDLGGGFRALSVEQVADHHRGSVPSHAGGHGCTDPAGATCHDHYLFPQTRHTRPLLLFVDSSSRVIENEV